MNTTSFFKADGLSSCVKTSIERRSSIRLPSHLDALCWQPEVDQGEPWSAVVKDISEGGVGLLSRRQLAQGEVFYLKLQSNFVDLTRGIKAEAVYVMACGEEGWRIGCKFLQELPASERSRLL
jgi:PilZ domain